MRGKEVTRDGILVDYFAVVSPLQKIRESTQEPVLCTEKPFKRKPSEISYHLVVETSALVDLELKSGVTDIVSKNEEIKSQVPANLDRVRGSFLF